MGQLYIGDAEWNVLRSFSAYKVRYLIIGGHAVRFYGHLRPTKDLDIYIDMSGENPLNIMNALGSINCYGSGWSADDLSRPKKQVCLGNYGVELLTSPDGPPFEEAYAKRVLTNQKGISVPVLAKEDLLEQKRKVGRPKDIEDIKALEMMERHE